MVEVPPSSRRVSQKASAALDQEEEDYSSMAEEGKEDPHSEHTMEEEGVIKEGHSTPAPTAGKDRQSGKVRPEPMSEQESSQTETAPMSQVRPGAVSVEGIGSGSTNGGSMTRGVPTSPVDIQDPESAPDVEAPPPVALERGTTTAVPITMGRTRRRNERPNSGREHCRCSRRRRT